MNYTNSNIDHEKQHKRYRKLMSLLTERVSLPGETTSMWDLLFRRDETYENMVVKPLLASEMRILEEK